MVRVVDRDYDPIRKMAKMAEQVIWQPIRQTSNIGGPR
jgi:hypothetical protein